MKSRSLRRKLLEFKAELDAGDEGRSDLVKLGKELHFFIIERAGNRKLEELVKALYEQIEMSRVYSYYKQRKGFGRRAYTNCQCLEGRNLEKSQTSLEVHFKNAFEMLMRIL